MRKPDVNGGSESSKIIRNHPKSSKIIQNHPIIIQNHPKSRTRVVFEIHLRRLLLIFTYLFY